MFFKKKQKKAPRLTYDMQASDHDRMLQEIQHAYNMGHDAATANYKPFMDAAQPLLDFMQDNPEILGLNAGDCIFKAILDHFESDMNVGVKCECLRGSSLTALDNGTDYLDIRCVLAKLSGVPAMVETANEHIRIIGEKLQESQSLAALDSPEAVKPDRAQQPVSIEAGARAIAKVIYHEAGLETMGAYAGEDDYADKEATWYESQAKAAADAWGLQHDGGE